MKIYANKDYSRERVYRYRIDGQSYFTVLRHSEVGFFEDKYGVHLEFWRECEYKENKE